MENKKFLIASDFHGSNIALDRALQIFDEIHADKLILLGDIFGVGADEMVEKLNKLANKLTIVKGNNDWYLELPNAQFKIFNETYENLNGKIAYLCHGHKLNDMFLEGYGARVVMIGHVHRPILNKQGEVVLLCPGSLACPRFGSDKTYAVVENNTIKIFNLDGETIDEMDF